MLFQIACDTEDYKFIEFTVSQTTAEKLFDTNNPYYARAAHNGWQYYWDHRTRTILFVKIDSCKGHANITIAKLDEHRRLRKENVRWLS